MSDVEAFYKDRHVFVTGATGFLGKCIIEKLLRSCPSVGAVYILIRPKKGKTVTDRLEHMLNCQVFERLRKEFPEFYTKIVPIAGDMLHDNLGMSESDRSTLVNNVSVIIHSAATVKFDEQLTVCIEMNLIGVRRMIKLCHQITKLEAFVHVSTAYSNCDRRQIEEKSYTPSLHPRKLLEATEWMGSDALNALSPNVLKGHPNNYTFTKGMAECILQEEGTTLPFTIVRPSIVGATWLEPIPGWVDNFNGPTGLIAAIGKGLLRTMEGDRYAIADLIPVDLAANLILVAAWNTATESKNDKIIYNCTSGQLNKYTWGQVEQDVVKSMMKNPVNTVVRLPNPRFTKNKIWHNVNILFDQIIPAYIMDLMMWASGRKPVFVRVQEKLQKAVRTLQFFTSNQWQFCNKNIFKLMERLNDVDRKLFNFDVRNLDWDVYIENYCLGTKQFVLKEELSSLPQARAYLKRLKQFNMCVNILLIIVIWRLMINRVDIIKSIWKLLMHWSIWLFQKMPRVAKS